MLFSSTENSGQGVDICGEDRRRAVIFTEECRCGGGGGEAEPVV